MRKPFLLVFLSVLFVADYNIIQAQPLSPKTKKLQVVLDSLIKENRFDSAFAINTRFLNQEQLDSSEKFTCHYLLATTYGMLNKKNQTIEELRKTLVYLNNKPKNNESRYVINEFIADMFFNFQQFDSALYYAKKARVYMSPDNSNIYNANIIGYCLYLNKDYKSAIIEYQHSISSSKARHNQCALPNTYSKLAKVYFYSNDRILAYKTVEKAMKLADSCKSKENLLLCRYTLVEFLEKDKKFDKAFLCLKEINRLVEETDKSKYAGQINQLEVEYETKLKERENEVLRRINSKSGQVIVTRRWELIVAVVSIEIFIIYTILLIRSSRKLKAVLRSLEEQKQQLERLNTLNQKIFTVISHDFKEPVLALQMVLKSLENKQPSAETLRTFTADISNHIAQSEQMLNSLLDWAKVELNIKVRELTSCNVFEIGEEIIGQLQKGLTEKKLQIYNHIQPTLNTEIPPDILRIVFRNIISNAIKFSYLNTTIGLSYDVAKNTISISDKGIGIPENKLERLFKSEVNPGIGTNHETGFGIGLYMCYELLQRFGSTLSATNLSGGGACFYISLPL